MSISKARITGLSLLVLATYLQVILVSTAWYCYELLYSEYNTELKVDWLSYLDITFIITIIITIVRDRNFGEIFYIRQEDNSNKRIRMLTINGSLICILALGFLIAQVSRLEEIPFTDYLYMFLLSAFVISLVNRIFSVFVDIFLFWLLKLFK